MSKRQARRQKAAQAKPKPQPVQPWMKPKKKTQPPAAKKMPDGYAGCFHCGSKKHFLNDCPQWQAAGRPPVDGAKRRKGTK